MNELGREAGHLFAVMEVSGTALTARAAQTQVRARGDSAAVSG